MHLAGADAASGTVHLVGAGPGDPGLITLRGLHLIETATLLAFDRLVASELVGRARPDTVLVDVGKRPGTSHRQADIDHRLVEAAQQGHAVVRIKGGDPFVFGRGGEEAAACVAAGVPFEVVPGITSAIAAPAAANIPVTHRGYTPAFAVVTGHEDPTKAASQLDWEALARFPGTLVILMGVTTLVTTTLELITHGRDSSTPAAIIEWATTPRQRVVESTLGALASDAERAGVKSPATVVVGDVVGMRSVLSNQPALVGAI